MLLIRRYDTHGLILSLAICLDDGQNMLLDAHGRLKLGDFGLSTLVEDGAVFTCRGSLAYAAPENLRCQSAVVGSAGYDGLRADIWSMGAVLFVLLYGAVPWEMARESCSPYRVYTATDGYPNSSPWTQMPGALRVLFHSTLALRPNRRWTAATLRNYVSRDLGWRADPVLLPVIAPRSTTAPTGAGVPSIALQTTSLSQGSPSASS